MVSYFLKAAMFLYKKHAPQNQNMKIKYFFLAAISCLSLFSAKSFAQEKPHPNVIIILTDDQGYGDLGITGNAHVQSPIIDRFANESIRFNNFYVSPVCAPTRSSLMTGRYSLRTGTRDTYNGGATMASNEVTLILCFGTIIKKKPIKVIAQIFLQRKPFILLKKIKHPPFSAISLSTLLIPHCRFRKSIINNIKTLIHHPVSGMTISPLRQ